MRETPHRTGATTIEDKTESFSAAVNRLRGEVEQAAQLTRQAFEQETQAAALIASTLELVLSSIVAQHL